MNKFGFIRQLLENERFNASQKERFMRLVSKELESSENLDNEILEDIQLIKDKIKLLEKPEELETIDKIEMKNGNNELKNYKDPKFLSQFLLEYNQNPILKYTCHTIENKDILNRILVTCNTVTYDYHKHLEIIHKNYNSLSFQYKGKVLSNVLGLISRYLGTYKLEEGWSENILIKWGSKELERWCAENPGKVPNPLVDFQNEVFRFRTIELKSGITISNFSDLVIHFKHLFHIKSGNSLRPLIENSIYENFNDENYNFQFDEQFSSNIDLFTYTEALLQAFKKIIQISKSHHNDPVLNVKLFFNYDENELKEFKIVITNSKVFGKNVTDYRPGDSITDLINMQINGLCDFYIRAYFEDNKAVGLVNIWDGNPIQFEPEDKEIEGVEFILKMY